jgi:hypothetical protein
MDTYPDVKRWLELNQDERMRLASQFTLRKTSATSVVNNTIVSDGHTHEDLKRLSVGRLIEFLGPEILPWYNDAQLDKLLSLTLDKIYGKTTKEPEQQEQTTQEVKPKRRGRPKKEKSDLQGAS